MLSHDGFLDNPDSIPPTGGEHYPERLKNGPKARFWDFLWEFEATNFS
jgi:hypothetical protein